MANLRTNACIALVRNGISYLLIPILCNFPLQRYYFFLNYANKKLIFPVKSKKGRKEIQKNRL